MRRSTVLIARTMIIILGAAVAIFLLYEPWTEGRNVGASVFRVYFQDPFLVYTYASSFPFFIGLRQLWKIVEKSTATQEQGEIIRALRIIQRCAFATAVLATGAIAYVVLMIRENDDIAGGVAMGMGVTVASFIVMYITHRRIKRKESDDE